MNIIKKINILLLFSMLCNTSINTGLRNIFQRVSLKTPKNTYKQLLSRKFSRKNVTLWWNQLKNKITYSRLLKKKKILQPSSLQLLRPTQLITPGKSPVLPLNEHVATYEKQAFDNIKTLFDFDDAEWKEITTKIKEIRDKNLRYLTSKDPNLEDFSNTHEQLPSHIKKILYDVLATYNINPQRIKIEISNLMPNNVKFNYAAVVDNNTLSFNKLMLERPNTFLKALIAHEIGHLIQGDNVGMEMILQEIFKKSEAALNNKKNMKYVSKNNITIIRPDYNKVFSEKQQLTIQKFIGSIEFTADALIASRNIDIARAMVYEFQVESPDLFYTYEKLFKEREENAKEEKLSLYEQFYPSSRESFSYFRETMAKVWGPDWLSPMHSALKIKEK